ncbi:MAG: membrane dipeptidase [Phormidesmis sp. FL-bin-119]|nr:membrane dipeptidase [Pedobacter sp.]
MKRRNLIKSMALARFAQFSPWDSFGNVRDLHADAFVMDGHIHMMSRQLLQGLDIELAKTASEIREINRRGKIAPFLDLEGGFDLDGDLNLLRALHRMGLTHAMQELGYPEKRIRKILGGNWLRMIGEVTGEWY